MEPRPRTCVNEQMVASPQPAPVGRDLLESQGPRRRVPRKKQEVAADESYRSCLSTFRRLLLLGVRGLYGCDVACGPIFGVLGLPLGRCPCQMVEAGVTWCHISRKLWISFFCHDRLDPVNHDLQ